jgi:hypothetical protein
MQNAPEDNLILLPNAIEKHTQNAIKKAVKEILQR